MTYNHYKVQQLFREQGILNYLVKLLNTIDVQFLLQNPSEKETLKLTGTVKILKSFTP